MEGYFVIAILFNGYMLLPNIFSLFVYLDNIELTLLRLAKGHYIVPIKGQLCYFSVCPPHTHTYTWFSIPILSLSVPHLTVHLPLVQ